MMTPLRIAHRATIIDDIPGHGCREWTACEVMDAQGIPVASLLDEPAAELFVRAVNREAAAPLATYIKLQAELDALIRTGKGDSDEADALRDRMDAPWKMLTEAEHEAVRSHSQLLNRDAAGEKLIDRCRRLRDRLRDHPDEAVPDYIIGDFFSALYCCGVERGDLIRTDAQQKTVA